MATYRTRSGRLLTEAELEALVDEAERGYVRAESGWVPVEAEPSKPHAAAAPSKWNPLWVFMWVVITATLIPLSILLPFRWWLVAVAVGFGIPEWIGLRKHEDAYPPLTSVTRRYVPRWIAIPIMSGLVGAVAGVWFGFPRPLALGAVFVLHSWIHDHFDVTYDE